MSLQLPSSEQIVWACKAPLQCRMSSENRRRSVCFRVWRTWCGRLLSGVQLESFESVHLGFIVASWTYSSKLGVLRVRTFRTLVWGVVPCPTFVTWFTCPLNSTATFNRFWYSVPSERDGSRGDLPTPSAPGIVLNWLSREGGPCHCKPSTKSCRIEFPC